MGTSKDYKMPTGGDWGPLKREVNDFVQNVGFEPVAPLPVVGNYLRIRTHGSGGGTGGRGGSAGSGGGGNGGGRSRNWSAGISTAARFGGFLSRASEVGLAEALREEGLGDLVGRPASEVSGALLEKLAEPGSTLDQAAAREALVELNDELWAEAETFADAEAVLDAKLRQDGLLDILVRFFGHYLYACFCRDFYERLLKKVGSSRVSESLRAIKDCIDSAIKAKFSEREMDTFNWQGKDAEALSNQVLDDVLDIFGVPA
jgi:hypothetical protein